jgi:hypothetical protein
MKFINANKPHRKPGVWGTRPSSWNERQAWDSLRPVSGGVVFSKLSKLLNQESALSAPCLQV